MKGRFTNSLFPYAKIQDFQEELQPLQEINEVVGLIKDGQWHILKDIINKAKLPKLKTNKILEFLANYNFINLDSEHEKVKASPSLMKFFKENQTS
jgi:hypothetical protein